MKKRDCWLRFVCRVGKAPLSLRLLRAEKQAIEDAITGLRKALEGSDAAAIEAAMNTLSTASHKLAEAMYAQPGADAAGAGAGGADMGGGPEYVNPGGGASGDGPVDAEFTVVEDDDKK